MSRSSPSKTQDKDKPEPKRFWDFVLESGFELSEETRQKLPGAKTVKPFVNHQSHRVTD